MGTGSLKRDSEGCLEGGREEEMDQVYIPDDLQYPFVGGYSFPGAAEWREMVPSGMEFSRVMQQLEECSINTSTNPSKLSFQGGGLRGSLLRSWCFPSRESGLLPFGFIWSLWILRWMEDYIFFCIQEYRSWGIKGWPWNLLMCEGRHGSSL